METKVIKFYMDEDSRPVKELMTLKSMKESLFKDQYFLALNQIESYLSALKRVSGKDDLDLDSVNNIFAFIGDRGSGKTSCMVSLRHFLISNADEGKAKLPEKEYENLCRVKFFSLDLIDPTYFDKNNDLLSLFLAKLYSSFQKQNKERRDDLDENKKMAFLNQISKTYRHLRAMTQDHCNSCDDTNVEGLVTLSAAVDLKQDIHDAVDTYIDYFDLRDQMLLLCIDDIDLNASQAVEMLEYIRKYFVQPNILVLMSLKLDQMEQVLKNSYKGLYCNEAKVDDATKNDIFAEMVERYVAKLLPQSQRIYMPIPEDYLDKQLEIYEYRPKNEGECKVMKTFASIRQAIPELIFGKTRYLFYNTESTVSYIVPRNFRNLRYLLKMLWTLKDYKATEKDAEDNYYNKDIFKNYFFETWTKNNLSQEKRNLVNKMISLNELLFLNKYVAKILYEKYYSSEKTLDSDSLLRKEVRSIVNDDNYLFKVSVGDVLGMLDDLSKRYFDEDDQRFFFFIRSFYSIKLYEAYDSVTEAEDSKSIKRYSHGGVVMKDSYNFLNDYETIVAGCHFNKKFYNIFSKEYIKTTAYMATDKIAELMYEVVQNGENSVTEHNKVQLIEFFMLAVTRNAESETQDEKVRTLSDIDYISPIKEKTVVFDLFSVFFNLSRIMSCYERFRGLTYNPGSGNVAVGEMFLKLIFSNNPLYAETLWYKFRSFAYDNKIGVSTQQDLMYSNLDPEHNIHEWKYYDRWLSCCCLRNAEIMHDFVQQLENSNLKSYDEPSVVFERFFHFASEYEIFSYDKKDNKNLIINFEFFKEVGSMLKNFDNKYFMSLFEGAFGKASSDGSIIDNIS